MSNEKKLLKISFLAEANKEDLKEIEKGFQKYGAEIVAKEFPEMENIGNFHIEEATNT